MPTDLPQGGGRLEFAFRRQALGRPSRSTPLITGGQTTKNLRQMGVGSSRRRFCLSPLKGKPLESPTAEVLGQAAAVAWKSSCARAGGGKLRAPPLRPAGVWAVRAGRKQCEAGRFRGLGKTAAGKRLGLRPCATLLDGCGHRLPSPCPEREFVRHAPARPWRGPLATPTHLRNYPEDPGPMLTADLSIARAAEGRGRASPHRPTAGEASDAVGGSGPGAWACGRPAHADLPLPIPATAPEKKSPRRVCLHFIPRGKDSARRRPPRREQRLG